MLRPGHKSAPNNANTQLAPGALAPATRPSLSIETDVGSGLGGGLGGSDDWQMEVAEAELSPCGSPGGSRPPPPPQRHRIFSGGRPVGSYHSPPGSPHDGSSLPARTSFTEAGAAAERAARQAQQEHRRASGGFSSGGASPESDEKAAARQRKQSLSAEHMQQRDRDTVFVGFGQRGYFFPNAFLSLPFSVRGTVLPHVAGFMAITALTGVAAVLIDMEFEPTMHELLGFIVGFLLIILGNFSHSNYEKAISAMNKAVTDGQNLLIDVLPLLPGGTDEGMYERSEFRRLVLLHFRLMCYDVRADIQARSNRTTWLDPNGSICTNQERVAFMKLTGRVAKREWAYHHPKRKGGFGHLVNMFGQGQLSGRFEVSLRPAVVQMWLAEKILEYATGGARAAEAAAAAAEAAAVAAVAAAAAAAVEVGATSPMPSVDEGVDGGGGGNSSNSSSNSGHLRHSSGGSGRGSGDISAAAPRLRLRDQQRATAAATAAAAAAQAQAAAAAARGGIAVHLAASSAVHARLLNSLDTYASNMGVMLTVDRTPLPYVYVQMASVLLTVFVLSLPFALLKSMGWATPVVGAIFAYAYGGLYINACILRNPFNYDGTSTGVPINAFIQRLEVASEALLLQGGYMEQAGRHVRAGPQRNHSFSQEHPSAQNSLAGTWMGSSGRGRESPMRPPISSVFPGMAMPPASGGSARGSETAIQSPTDTQENSVAQTAAATAATDGSTSVSFAPVVSATPSVGSLFDVAGVRK